MRAQADRNAEAMANGKGVSVAGGFKQGLGDSMDMLKDRVANGFSLGLIDWMDRKTGGQDARRDNILKEQIKRETGRLGSWPTSAVNFGSEIAGNVTGAGGAITKGIYKLAKPGASIVKNTLALLADAGIQGGAYGATSADHLNEVAPRAGVGAVESMIGGIATGGALKFLGVASGLLRSNVKKGVDYLRNKFGDEYVENMIREAEQKGMSLAEVADQRALKTMQMARQQTAEADDIIKQNAQNIRDNAPNKNTEFLNDMFGTKSGYEMAQEAEQAAMEKARPMFDDLKAYGDLAEYGAKNDTNAFNISDMSNFNKYNNFSGEAKKYLKDFNNLNTKTINKTSLSGKNNYDIKVIDGDVSKILTPEELASVRKVDGLPVYDEVKNIIDNKVNILNNNSEKYLRKFEKDLYTSNPEKIDLHKNKDLVFENIPISDAKGSMFYKSPVYNRRQSSSYYTQFDPATGDINLIRKSNHWGKFYTNYKISDLIKDYPEDYNVFKGANPRGSDYDFIEYINNKYNKNFDIEDDLGRLASISHNWELKGGNPNTLKSQAGKIKVGNIYDKLNNMSADEMKSKLINQLNTGNYADIPAGSMRQSLLYEPLNNSNIPSLGEVANSNNVINDTIKNVKKSYSMYKGLSDTDADVILQARKLLSAQTKSPDATTAFQARQALKEFDDALPADFRDKLAEANKIYRDNYQFNEARESASDVFRKGVSPQEFSDKFGKMTAEEKRALRGGLRDELFAILENRENETLGWNRVVPRAVQAKIRRVLGVEEGNKLIEYAQGQLKSMRNLNNVLGGSNTAEKLDAKDTASMAVEALSNPTGSIGIALRRAPWNNARNKGIAELMSNPSASVARTAYEQAREPQGLEAVYQALFNPSGEKTAFNSALAAYLARMSLK